MNVDNFGDLFGGLGVSALVLLVVFLVAREFLCWYWKINQRLALLTEIRNLLKSQSAAGHASVPIGAAQEPTTAHDVGI